MRTDFVKNSLLKVLTGKYTEKKYREYLLPY